MHIYSTISAIASPFGVGAVAIIRISGSQSFKVIDRIFTYKNTGLNISKQAPFSQRYGIISDRKEIIDDVLISKFIAPKSFTGEDMVEIYCHGSIYIQNKILQILFDNGVQSAEPGEFTLRAFRNGKIDLSQAEAIADLIHSENKASHSLAIKQLKGGIKNKLNELREKLLKLSALLELELDFAEEDVEFADRTELQNIFNQLENELFQLVNSFQIGNAIKNGIPVAIVGEPNVGKSTLLNRLLNEEKSIVSEIPGTTRDFIEDKIILNGISYRFIDTAGLRKSDNQIEKIGIERTRKKIEEAELVLWLVDAENPKIDLKKISSYKENVILVINKIDKVLSEKQNARELSDLPTVRISAKENQNIDKLTELIIKLSQKSLDYENNVIINNHRHFEALKSAQESLYRAKQALINNIPSDLIAQDIREVLHFLGNITGQITTDETLGYIFKNFCIGK